MVLQVLDCHMGLTKLTVEKKEKKYMSGPVDNGPSTNYRVVYLTGTPHIFLSIGSHVN
jgi:hypothetical protein